VLSRSRRHEQGDRIVNAGTIKIGIDPSSIDGGRDASSASISSTAVASASLACRMMSAKRSATEVTPGNAGNRIDQFASPGALSATAR
jgi:hypothetical protein